MNPLVVQVFRNFIAQIAWRGELIEI